MESISISLVAVGTRFHRFVRCLIIQTDANTRFSLQLLPRVSRFTPFTETRVFPSHAFSTYLFLTSNFIESFIVSLRCPISEVIFISSLSLSLSVIVQRVIQSSFNFRLIKFKFFERERQRISL